MTNHDVKAIEYFVKEKLAELGLREQQEFVHFGLTSQDINNTAVPMSIKDALKEEYLPGLKGILANLRGKSEEWSAIPMLARTHGQPASPTMLGKEFKVFVERLDKQIADLESIPISGKFHRRSAGHGD